MRKRHLSAVLALTGGTICSNTCTDGSSGTASVSGAVFVENNASFTMNGGTISENSARNGGGIYSYSDGVVLNAGYITNNSATTYGGVVYSEGNSTSYSTIHLYNALITGNSASYTGGGLWLCPTGNLEIYVTDGAAVYENEAKEAGDEVSFVSPEGYSNVMTVSPRALGGGIGANGGVVIGKSEVTKITVTKSWDDSNDEDGIRPDSVTVNLYNTVNGTAYLIDTAVLSEDSGWTCIFENLPICEDFVYEVKETVPEDYAASYAAAA